jgi:hypothetical protein
MEEDLFFSRSLESITVRSGGGIIEIKGMGKVWANNRG